MKPAKIEFEVIVKAWIWSEGFEDVETCDVKANTMIYYPEHKKAVEAAYRAALRMAESYAEPFCEEIHQLVLEGQNAYRPAGDIRPSGNGERKEEGEGGKGTKE